MSEKYSGKWSCSVPDCVDSEPHYHSQISLVETIKELRAELAEAKKRLDWFDKQDFPGHPDIQEAVIKRLDLVHMDALAAEREKVAALTNNLEHLKAETRRYQEWAKSAEKQRDEVGMEVAALTKENEALKSDDVKASPYRHMACASSMERLRAENAELFKRAVEAEKENLELRVNFEKMRELQETTCGLSHPDGNVCCLDESGVLVEMKEIFDKTPAQSLAEHDAKVRAQAFEEVLSVRTGSCYSSGGECGCIEYAVEKAKAAKEGSHGN